MKTARSAWNVIYMAADALCNLEHPLYHNHPCNACLAEAVRQQIETERTAAASAARAEALDEAAEAVLHGDIFEAYATGTYPADDIEADTRAHAAAFLRALAAVPHPDKPGTGEAPCRCPCPKHPNLMCRCPCAVHTVSK